MGADGFFERAAMDHDLLHIQACDVERATLPFPDGSMDLVTCFEVIEHLKSGPKQLLAEVRRVMSPAGVFLVTTPNLASLRSVVKASLGWSPQEMPRYHRDPAEGIVHAKEYCPHELSDLFACRGFASQRLTTFSPRRRYPSEWLAGALVAPLRMIGNAMTRRPPWSLMYGTNLLLVATKAPALGEEWPGAIYEP